MNKPINEIALEDLAGSVGSLAKSNALLRAELLLANQKIANLETQINDKKEEQKDGIQS